MHRSREESANDRQSNTQDKASQLPVYDSSIKHVELWGFPLELFQKQYLQILFTR